MAHNEATQSGGGGYMSKLFQLRIYSINLQCNSLSQIAIYICLLHDQAENNTYDK